MTKERDENLNYPKDKVIKWCAALLSGVVPGFAPEPSKSSFRRNQTLLKSCSDATGAADKPDHGWTPEQRRCTFQALSPCWWHDSEIKEIKRSQASGSIEFAGSSCYTPNPSQKHAIAAPLHPIIFVLDHVPKSLSPRCLNPIYTVLVWRLTFSAQVNCRLKGPAGGELLFQPGKLMFIWCQALLCCYTINTI